MIYLKIHGLDGEETYKLHSDHKRESELKAELLSKFQDSDLVTITGDGLEPETIRLDCLFTRNKEK